MKLTYLKHTIQWVLVNVIEIICITSLEERMATHSVFLPRKSYGQRSLAGYSPWGHKSWTRLSDKPPLPTTSDDSLIFTSSKSQISWIFSYTTFYGHNFFFHLSKYLRVELLNDGMVKYIRSYHIGGTVLPITLYEILHFQSHQLASLTIWYETKCHYDFNLKFSDS